MLKLRKILKEKNGFNLIELVIVIIIVSIMAIPISIILSRYMESIFQVQDLHNANYFANQEMAKVKSDWYAGYPNLTVTSKAPYNVQAPNGVTYVVTRSAGGGSTKYVFVSVAQSNNPSKILARQTLVLESGVWYDRF